jgi:hypothetical protein
MCCVCDRRVLGHASLLVLQGAADSIGGSALATSASLARAYHSQHLGLPGPTPWTTRMRLDRTGGLEHDLARREAAVLLKQGRQLRRI